MPWLFRFFALWPLAALHALGAGLGWLVWALSPRYRAQFRAHVAQAGLPFEVARPAIAEAGRFIAELPKLWMRPAAESCLANVRVEGQANAEQAFAQGRGVIFFGPHCGSFELGPQALAELYGPITAIYRPARKAWLARLERLARDRPQLTVVPASLSGIRLMGGSGADVRKVDLHQAIDSRLGAANKTVTQKELRNVGPSVSYKLRDAAGQAREFHNYMLPVKTDPGENSPAVYLLGVRETPSAPFQYLRIPVDAEGGMA